MAERYFQAHDWLIEEEQYHPEHNAFYETIFALGNGYMGVRGTPEEGSHGERSMTGTFLPLVYDAGTIQYDWCRVGFPTRSTYMVTSPNWTSITLTICGIPFDPNTGKLLSYRRTLNLREGTLTRQLIWEDTTGRRTDITSCRIVCQHAKHKGAIRYSITPLNYSGEIIIDSGIDGNVATNHALVISSGLGQAGVSLVTQTGKTAIQVVTVAQHLLTVSDESQKLQGTEVRQEKYIGRSFQLAVEEGITYHFDKIIAIATSRDEETDDIEQRAASYACSGKRSGFPMLLQNHIAAWEQIWQAQDIVIEGDPLAQQGIRYAIFNMEWNYAGDDPRLNIGAKGISGPGYGGLYFWDSEVYMLPYYTYTTPGKARNLLMQRYTTLEQAKDRARELGYAGALYPWTTLDGTDCAIPWEYDMLEQHISVAIPYGVWMYLQATGDEEFLRAYGAEMVIECSRFWASRVVFNERRQRYVINAVTGPDEYAMVVNNNCYTNTMAAFILEYAIRTVGRLQKTDPKGWQALAGKIGFDDTELAKWADIAKRMYIPFDRKLGIHPQDDAFLDMDPIDVASIPESEKPLLNHWPWERIIRHQVLKQPDVLLLMFLRNDCYTDNVKRANYQYYEPKTIHDSSLSPCIHSILAAELGDENQAFDYYLRSSRLDLDDVNGNAAEGIHIACMAGTWMSIVNGFAGMRLNKGRLSLTPHRPASWQRMAFNVRFRGRLLHIELISDGVTINLKGRPISVLVNNRPVQLSASLPVTIPLAVPIEA